MGVCTRLSVPYRVFPALDLKIAALGPCNCPEILPAKPDIMIGLPRRLMGEIDNAGIRYSPYARFDVRSSCGQIPRFGFYGIVDVIHPVDTRIAL
jgi:hypothetical protein